MVAARHHVIKRTGKFKAETSGHAGRLGRREGLSRFALTPFSKRLPHNATVEQAAELTPVRFAAALRAREQAVV